MKERIYKALTRNWTLKLFSLLVSFVLFLFVSVESNNVVEVEFPIIYDAPDGLVVVNDPPPPSRVVATLKGPWAAFRTTLRNMGQLEPVIISLPNEPGPTRQRIETEMLDPPAGMEVLAMSPTEVELTLDRLVEKLVMVEVDPLGRPAFGFEIASMRADPPRVRVEGPLTKMRTLDFVHTKPVNLRDRETDLVEEVKLQPPIGRIRLVDRTSVIVHVDIVEEFTERTFELPVRVENAPPDTQLSKNVVRVTLKGPRRFVDRLGRNALVAVVDVGQEAASEVEQVQKRVELRPALPDRTEILGERPSVTVSFPRRRRN